MEVQVKDATGGDAGTMDLADSVWNQKMNGPALHQVVIALQANKRQGGHDTKNRGDIIASNRKLRAQKHTGRARLGDRSSPTQRGGAVAHGPHPRSYRMRVPVKVRRLALKVALSDQLRRGRITFVDALEFDSPSTSGLAGSLKALGIGGAALVVTGSENQNLRKSASNLSGVSVQAAELVNALEITGARQLVVTRSAAERIDQVWGPAEKPTAAVGAEA
jgi:large subunit ribosomal protein L4